MCGTEFQLHRFWTAVWCLYFYQLRKLLQLTGVPSSEKQIAGYIASDIQMIHEHALFHLDRVRSIGQVHLTGQTKTKHLQFAQAPTIIDLLQHQS